MERIAHLIGGERVEAAPGGVLEVFDPARGEPIREVGLADARLVDRAIEVASEAQRGWAEASLAARQQVFFRYRELLVEHADEICELIGQEHGKVLGDARGEFARGLEVVEFACGVPQLLKGQFSDSVSRGVDTRSLRQPLGVVAGITPFNFPAMVPMWMFPLALATGNGFVLKPSERDPSASVRLAELFVEAGGPPGLFNVVQGSKAAVDAILAHPSIRAVSFVGSTPVARYVYETAARNGKRVQALGGAKNHMVVLPDADGDQVVEAAVSAAFGSSGERCMAIAVLVVVGEQEGLLEAIAERMQRVQVGPASDPASEMGPLITAQHRDRVASLIAEAVSKGARAVVDGREHPRASGLGFFLGPTLLDEVDVAMDAYREEIFGPVLLVLRASGLEEALALVNQNPYANGAAIFTRDGGAARHFVRSVDAGMVGVNVPIPVPVAYYSFGGFKLSLLGDTHVHGEEGVRFYTRGKVVTERWPEGPAQVSSLHFVTNR